MNAVVAAPAPITLRPGEGKFFARSARQVRDQRKEMEIRLSDFKVATVGSLFLVKQFNMNGATSGVSRRVKVKWRTKVGEERNERRK